MTNKTRKRLWPVSLAMAIAVVGMMAAFLMVASSPTNTQAHDGASGSTHCDDLSALGEIAHDGDPDNDHDCATGPTDTGNGGTTDPQTGSEGDKIVTGSTSASATLKLVLTIDELDADTRAGSSVELFLEDDFQVPDSIDRDDVYFQVSNANSRRADVNGGGRVYVTDPIEIDDDDHYGGDDDWSIRVYIPDMDTSDTAAGAGFDGPKDGDTLVLTFSKDAGIQNPSEEGTHSAGYKVLAPNGDPNKTDGIIQLNTVDTKSKVSLSDEDNSRGYEMTVTGSGFNNGVSAGAYVLQDAPARFYAAVLWEGLDCAGMKAAVGVSDDMNQYCFHYDLDRANMSYAFSNSRGHADALALSAEERMTVSDKAIAALLPTAVVTNGARVGAATVGSDDKVAITFEVTAPTFKPGNINRVAVSDGEGRVSSDADLFDLEPSIRVSPEQVSSGDTVTVFAQDFQGGSFVSLNLAGQQVNPTATGALPMVSVSAEGISPDGSATAIFEMPGGLEGTVRVDAKWGDASEDTKITIAPSSVSASKTDVLPNESITITGNGFASGACILATDIVLDKVPVTLDDESDDGCGSNGASGVKTSNAGQFVATVHLSPEEERNTNPTLIAGTHTLEVTDDEGFTGSVVLTVATPAITVTPDVAGPRDYISVSGQNWPVDNPENPLSDAVEIVVKDTERGRRYSAFADTSGRFQIEHQVHRGVAIPSTIQVEVKYDDIVKIQTFDVPVATINVDPGEAQPGDTISISATNMPVYTDADEVKIGGSVISSLDAHTDRDGNITIDEVLVPGLDPGTYSVQLTVKGTVAIGEIDILAESAAGGAPADLPGAVESLGDNLVAIFHFDDVGKNWSFYDPRPDFADLNTLTEMSNGEAYWILVSETADDVLLNNRVRSLTCRGDDCWNLEVW